MTRKPENQLPDRTCRCGKTFTPKQENSVCCSERCYRSKWSRESYKRKCGIMGIKRTAVRSFYCQAEIEGRGKCTQQCDHCKEYYKPLDT